MQIEKNLPSTDIYDHYILTDTVVIPYDNNYSYLIPKGEMRDSVLFRHRNMSGIITYIMRQNNLFAVINVHIGEQFANNVVDWIAASPVSRGYSYSGSGLPYPNPEIAYENTPNIGSATIDKDGDFSVEIEYPNAYYVRQGSILLNPHIHFYLKSKGLLYCIDVGRPIQNRSLTGLPDRYNRTTLR